MLRNLPVVRSFGALILFLATAVLTIYILLWSRHFGATFAATRMAQPFVYLFTVFDAPAAAWGLVLVVAAALVARKDSFRPLLGWIADHVWLIAGVACVALCIGTRVFYFNHPLTQDECAPYFQSRIFSAGHLAGQLPPGLVDRLISPLYQGEFYPVSHATGRVAEAYWPGFALLMTPFTFLGLPWACNPVISALTLPAIRRLAARIFGDRETAGLAVLLTLASPVFLGDGISFYSMAAHLLANCVFALLLLDPTPRRALAAGVVGSIALILHNPVPHMLFAVPWMLAIARRSDAARLTGCLVIGYLPLCLLLGMGWPVFTAGIAHEGMVAAHGTSSFDPTRFTGAFALPDSTIWVARGIGIMKIWLWAVPGMVLLAFVGGWKWRHNPHCRTLAASALVTLVGYVLVPFDQGHGWGYRYFHSAWMVLPLLAAGALARVPDGLRSSSNATPTLIERLTEDGGVRTYLVACALLSLTLGWGLRATQIREFVSGQMGRPGLPAYTGTEHRVVLMNSGVPLPWVDPWLRGDVIYLPSFGPKADAAVMHAYFPSLHQVFSDSQGTVWSAVPVPQSGT